VIRKVTGADRGRLVKTPVQPYRPRESRGPRDFLDWSDRHLSRATDDDQVLDRYVRALRALRSCVFSVALFALGSAALLIGGVMVAVHLAGVPLWAAIGIGGGGTSIGTYFMSRAILHRLRGRDVARDSSL
jgi:hypothetical protein